MFSGTLVITCMSIWNHGTLDHIQVFIGVINVLRFYLSFLPQSSFILIPLKIARSKKTKSTKKKLCDLYLCGFEVTGIWSNPVLLLQLLCHICRACRIIALLQVHLYCECLTKEALEGFGDFKIGGQIIHTVKYADDLVLQAKEERVLQDMIDKLIEIERCYGMEMNVEKTKIMRISRKSFPGKIMIDQKN